MKFAARVAAVVIAGILPLLTLIWLGVFCFHVDSIPGIWAILVTGFFGGLSLAIAVGDLNLLVEINQQLARLGFLETEVPAAGEQAVVRKRGRPRKKP